MRRFAVTLGCTMLLAAGPGSDATAQRPVRVLVPDPSLLEHDSESDHPARSLLTSDRNTLRRLELAREFLKEVDYSSAVRSLQGILDADEDSVLTGDAGDGSRIRSAKQEALRLLVEMHPEGQRAYENEFGPVARRLLNDATSAGSTRQLEEVVRRYFPAEAGRQAVNLLGNYHLDHGEPLSAALCFDRLLFPPQSDDAQTPMRLLKSALCWYRAGRTDKSIERLVMLKERYGPLGQDHVTVSGKKVPLFDDNRQALAWVVSVFGPLPSPAARLADEWSLFRGDPARNAVSAPVNPIWDPLWVHGTLYTEQRDDPLLAWDSDESRQSRGIETNIRQAAEEHRESGSVTIPASVPLAVDDVVVFRTPSRLRAVQLGTGELLWESADVDGSLDRLLAATQPEPVGIDTPGNSVLQQFLSQRTWQDQTYGTLSSDGRHVFLLEELGVVGQYDRFGRQTPDPPDDNKLLAFELDSGRLIWEVGGPRGDYELELAGTFFLGPPMPMDGSLFCLGEDAGEIRLLVLDASSGKQQWAQRIAYPEAKLSQYPLRRISGASTAFSNGVLVCPTTAGAVLGFDVARRLLLWGYRYPTRVPPTPADYRRRALENWRTITMDQLDRWVDSVPVAVNDRVLLTPRDSDELHCISLLDGSLVWKRLRGEGLYLAGVYGEAVIVVGRTQVRAWRLADGEDLWAEPTPIPLPSGRGLLSGGFYHLPLSTAEIATINLTNGVIEGRSRSFGAEVPGNLVAAGGALVSQSLDNITALAPLDSVVEDVRQRLADDANDAGALAFRGELRLHQGDLDGGLADLRQSLELNPDPRTKGVLFDRLVEGLRLDFASYADRADEIERLVTNPHQRMQYLRLYAGGLEKTENYREAFGRYLELADSSAETPELTPASETLLVRSDRWVRARFANVYARAPADIQKEIDRAIETRKSEASDDGDPRRLRALAAQFQDLPGSAAIRRALVEQLDPLKHFLELEQHLRVLRRSGAASISGIATARLASLLITAGRTDEAVFLIDELASDYADAVCLDDKTGRQLAEHWMSQESVAEAFQRRSPWPQYHFAAERKDAQHRIQQTQLIPIHGPRDRFNEHWQLEFRQDGSENQVLTALDGIGREMWSLDIAVSDFGRIRTNTRSNEARLNGHLLVVVLGHQLLAIDTAGSADAPQVVWTRDAHAGRLGLPFSTTARSGYRPFAEIGVLNEDLLCYLVETNLIAVDPLRGDTLWQRKNVPLGSRVFGDETYVFVAHPGSLKVLVLRASDGEQIATRELPALQRWIGTNGRNVVTWTTNHNNSRLAAIDAATGQNVWQRDFDQAAKIELIDDAEAAVLEEDGRFYVVSLADGQIRIDGEVEPVEGLEHIVVRRSSDYYVLLSSGRRNLDPAGRFVLPIHHRDPLVGGFAHGFDRATGQKLWSVQIGQQSVNLSQPECLPVLMLAHRQARNRVPGRRLTSPRNSLTLLDVRNGDLLRLPKSNDALATFRMKPDLAGERIVIEFYRAEVELTMTDTPLSEPLSRSQPEDDEDHDEEDPSPPAGEQE